MEVVCPALPALETLPFAQDRDAAWHMLLAPGKVAVSDAGVYFLSGADVVEEAATHPELFSSQGAFDLVGSPFPMVPIAFDPPEHTRFRRVLDKFFAPGAWPSARRSCASKLASSSIRSWRPAVARRS